MEDKETKIEALLKNSVYADEGRLEILRRIKSMVLERADFEKLEAGLLVVKKAVAHKPSWLRRLFRLTKPKPPC